LESTFFGRGGVGVVMVVGYTTTCTISAYHHLSCEFEPRSWQGVLDTILCDKVCQWLAFGHWVSSGIQVSSTYKTDRHDITVWYFLFFTLFYNLWHGFSENQKKSQKMSVFQETRSRKKNGETINHFFLLSEYFYEKFPNVICFTDF
jgi:hypothetical protein